MMAPLLPFPFAAWIAARSEPAPESLVLVTVWNTEPAPAVWEMAINSSTDTANPLLLVARICRFIFVLQSRWIPLSGNTQSAWKSWCVRTAIAGLAGPRALDWRGGAGRGVEEAGPVAHGMGS